GDGQRERKGEAAGDERDPVHGRRHEPVEKAGLAVVHQLQAAVEPAVKNSHDEGRRRHERQIIAARNRAPHHALQRIAEKHEPQHRLQQRRHQRKQVSPKARIPAHPHGPVFHPERLHHALSSFAPFRSTAPVSARKTSSNVGCRTDSRAGTTPNRSHSAKTRCVTATRSSPRTQTPAPRTSSSRTPGSCCKASSRPSVRCSPSHSKTSSAGPPKRC